MAEHIVVDTVKHAGRHFVSRELDPQGMMITEMWIDRIARTVGKSSEEVRMLNMYKNNEKTFYGQVLDGCQLQACWDNVSLPTIQFSERAS